VRHQVIEKTVYPTCKNRHH